MARNDRIVIMNSPFTNHTGQNYGQYADEVEVEPADRQRFTELADQWEIQTVFLSNSERASKHPAYQEIIGMGKQAVPLILERMRRQGGHWFIALRVITGDNPVKLADRGKVAVMQASWLEWGEANGYI